MADNPKIDTIELDEVEYDIDIKIDSDVLALFTADGWEDPSED